MDILFMNLIMIIAFAVMGYYIIDAFISIFSLPSDTVTKVRHKRALHKALSVVNGSKTKRRSTRSFRRVVNQ